MKVLLSWLKDFVEFDLTAAEIARGLTLQGTEAESVQLFADYLGDDAKVVRITVAPRFVDETTAVYGVEIDGVKADAKSHARHIPIGFKVIALSKNGSLEIPTAAELGLNQQKYPVVVPNGMTIDEIKADAVIEFETLSNRGDLLSHIGMAREVSILTGNALREPAIFEDYGKTDEIIAKTIELAAPDLCPRYIGISFSGVKIEDSPDWIWYRLIAIGLNPISNIVDITNYVLMELGQPLHAFDPDKLDGGIIVRRAKDGEKFAAINHNEYELTAENLVIADQSKAVAIGGIMGGLDSEISDSTAELFLESAYFTPVNIRKSTKKLALMSDSSLRFGRGVDTDGALRGAMRFAKLLLDTGGANYVAGSFRDADVREAKKDIIEFPVGMVKSYIGIDLPEEEIVELLKSAGFAVDGNPPIVKVTPPTWRGDFEIAEDVSEEVLRLYSYTKITPELPVVRLGQGRQEGTFAFESRIRDILVSMSLQEVRTYTLINPDSIRKWHGRRFVDQNRSYSELLPEVAFLANPDTADMSALRNTLGIGLIEVLTANRKKHFEKLPVIYEIGRVFGAGEPNENAAYRMRKNGSSFYESRRLGVLASTDMIPPAFCGANFAGISPLFVVKAILQSLIGEIGQSAEFSIFAETAPVWAQDGTSFEVLSAGVTAGAAGILKPEIDPFEGERGAIAYAEINLDELMNLSAKLKSIESPSQYPPVLRDLALVLPLETPAASVTKAIKVSGGENLEAVSIFDQYAGKNLKPISISGKEVQVKNLAFAMRFQRTDRTLASAEVDAAVFEILKKVFGEFGARLRDYEHVKSDTVFSDSTLWGDLMALYGNRS